MKIVHNTQTKNENFFITLGNNNKTNEKRKGGTGVLLVIKKGKHKHTEKEIKR